MLKTTIKPVSVIMAVSLALGLFAALPRAAGAADISKPSLAAAVNLGGTEVYFGSYGSPTSSPIRWYVVETGSGTATLWTTTSMGDRPYDTSHSGGTHQNWSESDICVWLNGAYLLAAFNSAERAAIITAYGSVNEPYGGGIIDSRQTIVLPSVAEIGDVMGTGTWGIPYTGVNDGKRGFGTTWWLRSPGPYVESAAIVRSDGHVFAPGENVSNNYAIRPALKLNLASVLITSAASGASGKSTATVGSGLVGASAPTGAVKLTVLDSSLSLSGSATVGTVKAGDTVSIPYTGAATGANRTVSCVIEDSGGAVLFYGKLSTAASGTASFTVPAAADLPDGSYTIKLFNEECNADNYTDFASTPVPIPMTVNSLAIAPTITSANSTTAVSGVGGTFQVTGTGDVPITYSLDGTEPAGVTINGTTGLITIAGTTAVGTHTFTIIASNGVNPAATQNFTLTVNPSPVVPSPTVVSVFPSGTNAPTSGSVVITFSTPMNPAIIGTVQLNPVLTGGAWSAGNTVFTIPYSGLNGGATYAVNISGFADAAGNMMLASSSHSFTTEARPASPLPQTGDGFPIGALLVWMGVLLAGMGWIGFRMKGRRTRA